MIKGLMVAGWVGVLLLIAGGSSGFLVKSGGDELTPHIVGAILSSSLLLFFHLCMLIYVNGVYRLIVRSVAEHELGDDWLEIHGSIVIRANLWLVSGLAVLVLAFASGVPVYTGRFGPTPHLVLFVVAAILEVCSLIALKALLDRGEEQLVALDAAVG